MAKPTWHHFGGKSIGSHTQKTKKRKEKKEKKEKSSQSELMIWRTKM